MGTVLQFKMNPREESCLPERTDNDSIALVFCLWSFGLVQKIFSSLRLTYWYWHGHEVVMDFEFDSSVAKFLNHPSADDHIWRKLHAVYFEHFCQKMEPSCRAPFTVKKFYKSKLLDDKTVRIYFEAYLWAGDDEKPEYYGVPQSVEDLELFECRFMLEAN